MRGVCEMSSQHHSFHSTTIPTTPRECGGCYADTGKSDRGFGHTHTPKSSRCESLLETSRSQRRTDSFLPVGGKHTQVGHVNETVVIEVAARPRRACLPVGSQRAQVGDIDLAV